MGASEIIVNICLIVITVGFIFYILGDFFLYKKIQSNDEFIEELNSKLTEMNNQIRLDADQTIQDKFKEVIEKLNTKIQKIESVDKIDQV